jgi:hypothetical protein
MESAELSAQKADPLQRIEGAINLQPRFVIGRGLRGGWIVNDRLDLVGGIFVSEAAARHFAFEESGGHGEQVIVASRVDDFEFGFKRAA